MKAICSHRMRLKIQIDIDPALLQREEVGAQWKFALGSARIPAPDAAARGRPVDRTASSDAWRASCRKRKQLFPCHKEAHSLGEIQDAGQSVRVHRQVGRRAEWK